MLPYLHFDTNVLRHAPDILAAQEFPLPCVLVCDTHTYEVATRNIEKKLGDDCIVTINLGLNVKPTMAHALHVADAAQNAASILVVGSGTLNDIAKVAAYKANIPYALIATAASMNGYSSANASLLENGLKTSVSARPPSIILADIDVIRSAPIRLSQAGLGDTLCRASIQADALLAHLCFDGWYDSEYFANAQLLETQLLEHSKLLLKGDADYFKTLFHALIFSGNAMTLAGSSAPASQSEHIIAHCLELLYPKLLNQHFHGEHIAVTSLTSLRLQHYLMSQAFVITPTLLSEDVLSPHLTEAALPYVRTMRSRKELTQAQCDVAMQRLEAGRERLKAEFEHFTLSPENLENALHRAEIATWPEHLGVTREEYDIALKIAHLTRDRFTFLDIAAMRRGA